MKAIGKGSLASILAAGLHIARIVIFIAFFGLAIAAAVIPLAGLIETVAEGVAGEEIDLDVDVGDFIEVLTGLVLFGMALYIVNRLLEILRTLREGSPFVRENADRFKKIGYALLLGEAAKIVLGIFGFAFDADLDVGPDPVAWLAIVAVFVLAEVFLQGAKMKEEQDLTV
jgi:hypothetical protein